MTFTVLYSDSFVCADNQDKSATTPTLEEGGETGRTECVLL